MTEAARVDLVERLHAAVAAAAPINGVSIGEDAADRAAWRVDFAAGATAEQRSAALAALNGFSVWSPLDEQRADAMRMIEAAIADRWSYYFGDARRAAEREQMAEIAIRCSSPDAAVAAANRALLQPEATLYGQTIEERVSARLEARAVAQRAASHLSVARQKAEIAVAAATAEQLPGVIATALAEIASA